MRRLWPLVLIPILVVWLALPRPAPRGAQETPAPDQAAATSPALLGAPQALIGATTPSAGVETPGWRPAPQTPRPSGGIGEPLSYCKPQFCETPQPRIVDGISGEATWWNTFGSGFYVALRPDLGSKGDLVIVCGGAPFHCRSAEVITSCACLGPNSERLVDLSRDLFAEFANPSVGVVRVVIQVVGR